jgi:hypothetical protein
MPKIYGTDIVNETSVGGGISAIYKFSTTTTIADPLAGYFRLNNATPASVTTIAISKIDSEGFTRDGLSLLRNGDTILFSSTHQSVSQAYELTAEPVDNTTWYSFTVTNKLTNGSFGNHDKIEVTAVFSGASKYTELSDVPQSFTGDAGKLVAVNSAESGLEHRILTATDIPNLSANKITSDLINTARLATGTANNTTYLRGDQTWQTINAGGATVQANPPTATTNAALGSLVYAQSNSRIYACVDATTNANTWAYWNNDGQSGVIQRPYPGGTLTNDVGAGTAPNKVIADTDILWAIGTNLGTTGFTNPIDGTRIVQTNSGLLGGGYASPVVLADRSLSASASGQYAASSVANSWFCFDFGTSLTIFVDKIAIQQRGDLAGNYHRTLAIQYSSNGTTFTTATTFTATNAQGDWSLFDVTGFISSRYLRIMHTSLDNLNQPSFLAAELLLWGAITNV